ncbi:serine protease inhibitor 28Dc-like [Uranotaenia lowii]|uniref:serine protease inhibitor 28Dc-like n=1 Tax=Uranotaenia lowii TaxID=190385 RepID=UPI00247930B2|nr:serine protease inhibitor 28Dc-like [Uranotaenia lowii]
MKRMDHHTIVVFLLLLVESISTQDQSNIANNVLLNSTVHNDDILLSAENRTQLLFQRNDLQKLPGASNQVQPEFRYDEASFAVTELARKIGHVLGQQSNAGIFSPVSIACALSLLLLGSNSNTKEELSAAMGFNIQRLNDIHRQYGYLLGNLASRGPDKYPIPWRPNDQCSVEYSEEEQIEYQIINLANAIFVRNGLPLNQRYVDLATAIYNSSIQSLNFETDSRKAAASINYWASQNTFGKINRIVSENISPDTQMIVANALYFKGIWKNSFEVGNTMPKMFYPNGYESPETAKEVLTMLSYGCYPFYDGTDEFDAKVIGLPYQGEKTALYIIMPNNSTRKVLQKFQRNLDAAKIGTMVSRMTVKESLVQIPKMKISNTLNLRDVLQQLNVRGIFNPVTSNLSSMLKSKDNHQQPPLFASEIIHKVELDINEQGTEGGAVTASTVFRRVPAVKMKIDRPFLMMLGHDDTRLPLFYGSVFDPVAQ